MSDDRPAIPVWIDLTKIEWSMAVQVGHARQEDSVSLGSKDANGFVDEGDGIGHHINGACAEMIVCKWQEIYYNPTIRTYKAADIGAWCQVRNTGRHDGPLTVRPRDNPGHFFVLVTGTDMKFCIRGYYLGGDARRDEWWTNFNKWWRPYVWAVPQRVLLGRGETTLPLKNGLLRPDLHLVRPDNPEFEF